MEPCPGDTMLYLKGHLYAEIRLSGSCEPLECKSSFAKSM